MQRRTSTGLLAAFCALLLAGGCVESVPETPPPPARAQEARPVPNSVLDVPVEVDLGLVRDLLEREVPREIAHEKTWERDGHAGLRYYVERGPFDVSFQGGELQVRTELKYRARACVGLGRFCQPVASCGYGKGGLRHLEVELSSPVSLGPDWGLQTQVRERHDFTDPCKITLLRVDITKKLDRLLTQKIRPILPLLDRQLAEGADVRTRASAAWKKLEEPIEVRKGVWLDLAPSAARVSPPTAGDGGRKVRFVLGVTGKPRLVAGDKPEAPRRPLPRLARSNRKGGFSLYVQGEVPYEAATRLLRDLLKGKRFDAGGHRTVVRDVAIVPGPGGAAVRLDLETVRGFFRKVRGSVYLVGRPAYDPETGVLSLEDLDYSVESKDMPVQLADFLLRQDVLDYLRENAHFDVGGKLDEAKALVTNALDRQLAPGIRLRGRLTGLEPLEVVAGSDRFVATVKAKGKASLAIGPEAGKPRALRRGAKLLSAKR